MSNQSPEARAAWCAAMRAFVAMVESNSAVPVPTSVDVWAHLQEYNSGLSQAQRVAAVHDFAELFGMPVKADRDGDRSTRLEIGEIRVYVHGYLDRTGKERELEGSVITREQDAELLAADAPSNGQVAIAAASSQQDVLDAAFDALADAEQDDTRPPMHERPAGECGAKTVDAEGETGLCCLQKGHDDPDSDIFITQLDGVHFDPKFGHWNGLMMRRAAHVESDERPGTCRHCNSALLGMGYCLFPPADAEPWTGPAGNEVLDAQMASMGALGEVDV